MENLESEDDAKFEIFEDVNSKNEDIVDKSKNLSDRLNLFKKYGYEYISELDCDCWLVNMATNEFLNDDKNIINVLELSFINSNSEKYLVNFPYKPYFYIQTSKIHERELSSFLQNKFNNYISNVEIVERVDLDQLNHLIGLKNKFLKVSFLNISKLSKFKIEVLSKYLKGNVVCHDNSDEVHRNPLEYIQDIREHDVPYYMRVAIDNSIFVGKWYSVFLRKNQPPIINQIDKIIPPPDLTIMAFDIETTKALLKFPESSKDSIIIISYVINKNGYLLINRQIVSENIENFEYSPKMEFCTNVTVFNVPDEKSLLLKWLDHIQISKPDIFVTYNGDFFDWSFIDARCKFHQINLSRETGFYNSSNSEYLSPTCTHMDCLYWVKRDSYLPIGSHGLKAVTRAKLQYDPVEVDPEEIVKMANDKPQNLCSYAISDAVATYYLYMQYVHPFIFALCTIIPMKSDEVLRKGSGTLCESLLMAKAYIANIIYPNKQKEKTQKFTKNGNLLENETYVGGHVESIESGIFRSDFSYRFKIDPKVIEDIIGYFKKALKFTLKAEIKKEVDEEDFNNVCNQIQEYLQTFKSNIHKNEHPLIYHLDVAAMYPNIMLTNKLQPPSIVDESVCASCDFNVPFKKCQRRMDWVWRGDFYPTSYNEYIHIKQQLQIEMLPNPAQKNQHVPFSSLGLEEQDLIIRKRISDYSNKVYGKRHLINEESRQSLVCQCENSFFIDTVRAFRDRRYEFKESLKKWKKQAETAKKDGNFEDIIHSEAMCILYDSLQLAHKCILNSFYGYAMRRGSRWFSMEMAGIVCNTGANIIKEARTILEGVGRPLELDTDGIWCMIPSSFPTNLKVKSLDGSSITLSLPGAILNYMVYKKFSNNQYHVLVDENLKKYAIKQENSIFFEVDGPYLGICLPASKEENKKLKKRYAVFDFNKKISELKGFEIKRRGELNLIKIFQNSFFENVLKGSTLDECYKELGNAANYWLDILFNKAKNMDDHEFLNLISEHKMMSKPLHEYGSQKSTSITTAKRLSEFLGEDMIRDKGLTCRYIISHKPSGMPVAERAVPVAIFQTPDTTRKYYLRRWLHSPLLDDVDPRSILDWDYYITRLFSCIQKMITIPALMQNINNPVARCPYPAWLHKKITSKIDKISQNKITEHFKKKEILPECNQVVVNKENITVKNNVLKFPSNPKEVIPWVEALKRKWNGNEVIQETLIPTNIVKKPATLQSLLNVNQDALLTHPWKIIQIRESSYAGIYDTWVYCNSKLHRIKIQIPKIFYVNSKVAKNKTSRKFRKVSKILPRSKISYNLFEYSIEETTYYKNYLKTAALSASSIVEGVYETQTPSIFRIIYTLGNQCKLTDEFKNEIKSIPSLFSFKNLEMVKSNIPEFPINDYIHVLFIKTNLIKIASFYNTQTNEIIFCFFLNNPKLFGINLQNIIETESTNYSTKSFIYIGIKIETDQKKFYDQCNYSMKNIRNKTKGAKFNILQSNDIEYNVRKKISSFEDYLTITLKKLQNLPSQNDNKFLNNLIKFCVENIFNHKNILEESKEISDYLLIPLGNLPTHDYQIYGWDIFFARQLTSNHMILWTSSSQNPDFGNSSEMFLNYKELDYTMNYDKPGFYYTFCVELRLEGLAVDSIIKNQLLQLINNSDSPEGTFNEIQSASLCQSLTRSKPIDQILLTVNDTASCASAFNTLKSIVIECMKQVNHDQSVMADQLLIHLYRYLCSTRTLLYDPGLCRFVRDIMNKILEQLLISFEKLNCKVIHLDFHKIVLNVNKIDSSHGWYNIKNVVSYVLKQEIFTYITLIPTSAWRNLFWIDKHDYGGVKCDVPSYFANGFFVEDAIIDDNISMNIEVNFSITNLLTTESIKKYFNIVFGSFLKYLNDFCKEIISDNSNECVLKYILNEELAEKVYHFKQKIISSEINQQIFEIVYQFEKSIAKKILPNSSATSKQTLKLVKIICEVFSHDNDIKGYVEHLRSNSAKIIGISEYSDDVIKPLERPSYVIPQVFCSSCNDCRDIDLFRDLFIQFDSNKIPFVKCNQCFAIYDKNELEQSLLNVADYSIRSYLLQDLKCKRCKKIRTSNLSNICTCGSDFELTIDKITKENLVNLNNLSKFYNFNNLSSLLDSLIIKKKKTIKLSLIK